ncbi:hypothetical protein SERLADRAFT_447455 [Serpula lacrymans var. lacrymans S7.9]|uniref:Major facilitator superfamily (MFS) profile domain-containing protein n=1 Tax=Serpula lacrymans var. lacrymans (strain S7.9) TaxID=578457 RepID=F8NR47_SERL9|nr:uncharacterized protein SERLADRAFT_447455 [Serpula lacrymans var. lacrymans S7.9]EGO26220.1 hypothetical protein SERLADRAFT_447455 [Serpula lacrymans var. lacrymans S7.9]
MVLIGIFLSPLINAAARFKGVAPTCILLYSGCFIMISGVILRTVVTRLTPKILGSFYLLLLGVGGGLVAQTGFLLAQASVSPEDCAVANALAVFWETLGGSFGLSISGAVNRVELTKRFSKIPSTLINPETLAAINRNPRLVHTPGILNEYTRELVINEFVGSLLLTFRVCVVFAGVIFLTSLLVKHEGLDDAEDSDNSE